MGVALSQFHAASQLRLALPLTQLDEAHEEMETFIQSRLKELRSPQETKNLIGELSSRITDHRGRVRELLRSEPLRHPEVTTLVMVGLAADRPIESNFFPSLLEGLLGSLGMAAPGEGNPPISSREGAGHTWSTAMRGAISRTEQKEVEAPEAVGLPPNLDLWYKESFLEKQRHLIPPIFSDPLFIPKVAKAVFRVAKPLVVSKVLPAARSHKVSSAPPQPGGGGPEQQVLKLEEPPRRGPTPSTSSLPSQASLIPAGTGGGARLGGRAFRWEHLLSIRCCMYRFLPSWSRRLLLRHLRSRLTETRSCWYARRGLWFAAPADTSSCQQVLCSERRQRVHELDSRISRW